VCVCVVDKKCVWLCVCVRAWFAACYLTCVYVCVRARGQGLLRFLCHLLWVLVLMADCRMVAPAPQPPVLQLASPQPLAMTMSPGLM
jgi:hypothetical protein